MAYKGFEVAAGDLEVRDHETDSNIDPNKPLILLLHGLRGSRNDMVDPAASRGEHIFDYRAPLQPDKVLGRSYYPRVGPYSLVPGPYFLSKDAKKPVRSWRDFLQQQRYPTAAYSQVEPAGFLAKAVRELAELVDHLRRFHPRIVLLAHSRGGLLARRFLKENRTNRDLVSAIVGVITLHSPHRGSGMANIGRVLDWWIESKIDYLVTILMIGSPRALAVRLAWEILDPLKELREDVRSNALQELSVDGPLIADLESGEEPLPGVTYATFGGTSILLSRLLHWSYTLGSAVPRYWLPPNFRATIAQGEFPVLSPIYDGFTPPFLEGVIPDEFVHGKGDLLVTDARSRLRFAMHGSNPLNHAEALWDEGLQEQVLRGVLNRIHPPGPGTVTPETGQSLRSVLTELLQMQPPLSLRRAIRRPRPPAGRAGSVRGWLNHLTFISNGGTPDERRGQPNRPPSLG